MDAHSSKCSAGWYAWISIHNTKGDGVNLRYRIEREVTYPSLYNTEWGTWGDA